MKKVMLLVMIICLVIFTFPGHAEDLSAMTLEELTVRRQQLIDELAQINDVRGKIIKQNVENGVMPEEALGKIIDLFPDEEFAKIIRDECAKFSVEQTITQVDLDLITNPTLYFGNIHSFEGIGYLRNLRVFSMGSKYDGPFPERLRECKSLEVIEMTYCENVTEIPEWIGELSKLQNITIQCCSLSGLPDSICELQNLKRLYLNSNSGITSLPNNIGNCSSLKELNISGTSISELPASIWNLDLTTLKMSGTSIR